METTLKNHIANENWEAIHYLYEEASQELRIKFAFHFGKACLLTLLSEGIETDAEVEQMAEAFRISLYDYRLAETIREKIGTDTQTLVAEMDRKAWRHIQKSSNGEPNSADHSKYGSEYYLLIFYLHPDRNEVRKKMSRAVVFLLETFVALHINNTCENEDSWESLCDLLVRAKTLDHKFISAVIAFLRIYNAFKPTEKLTQLSFVKYLTTRGEKIFTGEEQSMLASFVKELEAEAIELMLGLLQGTGGDPEKSEKERITRAEELRQFAIDNANCPENLDHHFFQETVVYKKVLELLDSSQLEEAFLAFQEEFPEGLPEDSSIIRPLFTQTVTKLYQASGRIKWVVKALEMDPSNKELNELLMT